MENISFAYEGNDKLLLSVDGEQAGYLLFEKDGDNLNIGKTFVDPKFAGRGLAKRLRKKILEDGKEKGLSIKATCSFAKAYLEKRNAE